MFEKITRGRLVEAYGVAEAAPAILAMPLAGRRQSGVVGLPLPDTEAKIVDLDSGLRLEAEQIGELWVRGPQVFSAYGGLSKRALAASARVLHEGWLATGDIASMDENGFFTIIERKENMLLKNGQRVFPRQVEEALYEHPAIALARVSKHVQENGCIELIAQVTLHNNLAASEEELMKYCARRLPPSSLPDHIELTLLERQTG
jgi:long-chain acyl-CoA synthetase